MNFLKRKFNLVNGQNEGFFSNNAFPVKWAQNDYELPPDIVWK